MKIEKAETAYLIIGYFVGLEKYGIDVFYNRKYQSWLFDNSTDKDSLHPEFDVNGFIVNAKFTPFHNSVPLTENDFIIIQIKHLNTLLDLKDLKSMDLLKIQHFKKYLENRLKTIIPEPLVFPKSTSIEPQQNINIDKYITSFDVTYFGESADKRNPDGSKNDFYTGETFTTWLHDSDLRVKQYKEPLIQKKDELLDFNHTLYTLVNDIIRLYKQIRLYDSSSGETGIYLAQRAVLKTLSRIEFYSKKIKHCVLDSMQDCAILFKIYCVEKFEEIIFNIEEILFIRVYDSPLKEDFKKVSEALKNSMSEFKEPLRANSEPFDLSNNTKEATKEVLTNNTYYKISTPQESIDVFLYNDLNIDIFEYIEGIQYEGKPNTLDYFNLLFSEFNFFVENINNYLKIKEHFVFPKLKTALRDDDGLYLKSLLYFKLVELIKYAFPIESRKNIILKACGHIEKINQALLDFNFQPLHYSDDFKLLREDFEKLDYKSQLIEWTNIKYAILQDEEENIYTKKEASIILKKIDFEIERIEKLVKIEQAQKVELSNFIKSEDGIKEVLTDETYYSILEKCTIEAFECLKLKDHYPKDGTKAVWDVSTLTIQKGDGLPTNADNELFGKLHIKENMRVTFLMALDRHWKDFEIKYLTKRSYFYKKCYQSLLFKVSESPLWNKPDFGIDINNPCKLTFIWNMRTDIEARSRETKQPELKPLDLSDTLTIDKNVNFKNNFDKVDETKVFEYFKTNLVDKKHLSETALNNFLSLAFDKKILPKQKFSFEKLNTKNNIVTVFYKYYKDTAGSPYGRQPEYLNLLKNYFNGFEKINIRNFSK